MSSATIGRLGSTSIATRTSKRRDPSSQVPLKVPILNPDLVKHHFEALIVHVAALNTPSGNARLPQVIHRLKALMAKAISSHPSTESVAADIRALKALCITGIFHLVDTFFLHAENTDGHASLCLAVRDETRRLKSEIEAMRPIAKDLSKVDMSAVAVRWECKEWGIALVRVERRLKALERTMEEIIASERFSVGPKTHGKTVRA